LSVKRTFLIAGTVLMLAATPLLIPPAHAATAGHAATAAQTSTAAQPLNIVALGDSYASGDGDIGSGWTDAACLRSAGAAPERAADLLNTIRPVTFTSLACYNTVVDEPSDGVPAQSLLYQLSQVDPSRTDPVDALTISIGGNDIGFSTIVADCMIPLNSCSTDPSLLSMVSQGLDDLPGELDQLVDTIDQRGDIDNVFLTAYPDPTTGPGGVYCGIPGPYPGFEDFDYITQPDSAWASTGVIDKLNDALAAAVSYAQSLSGYHTKWYYVGAIQGSFSGHGFCTGVGSSNLGVWTTPRYVETPDDSATSQGDILGTMHPDDLGQEAIASILYQDYESLPLMSASVTASGTPEAGAPSSFAVQALTFDNAPVANASVLVNGTLVGQTNSIGTLNVTGYTFSSLGQQQIVVEAAGYNDASTYLDVQYRAYGVTSSPSPIPVGTEIGSLTLTARDSGTGQLVAGTFTIGGASVASGASVADLTLTVTHQTITIIGTDGKPHTITVTVCPTLMFQPSSPDYAAAYFSKLIACSA
jgi:lysophospholipase L1-like esterase